ncbi:syntaxin-8 [Microplitis mediator]|uniref:syntaxin-8 n=1 Tax=Microplitis mediator TaxID=375433 RepID=UPI00255319E5|nr:syntaxin-8 [Microplitis mediator]
MALIYLDDNDPWITEYDVCEKLYDDIMEQLNQRQSKPKASLAFASLSANVRIQMNQYSDHILQLKKKVAEALKLRLITVDEAERRTRQIEQLQSNYVKIKRFYDLKMNPTGSERPSLFGNSSTAFADGGTVGWDDQNDQSDSNVNIADLKSQNQAALLEQERGLDELYKVITRQKTIAQTINTEVDHQNEIIDDLAEHMEQTDERLIDGTRQIRFIDRKDRTCGYWVVIILLFISIICVAVV